MIHLNWISQYGLEICEKDDIEVPMLIVPPEIFCQLKKDWQQMIDMAGDNDGE